MKKLIFAFLLVSHFSFAADTSLSDAATEGVEDNFWRFSLGGSLNVGNRLKFDELMTSGSNLKYTAELEFDPHFSLEGDARYLPMNSWGFIGGLVLESEKKATKATISSGTASASGTSNAKIQASILFASAAYRWHQFYLPFGLNVSAIKYTPDSSFTGTHEESGGLGAQLGVGYYFTPNFVGEAHSRAVAVKLKSKTTTTTDDYGTGFLSSLVLTGKYLF